MVTPGFMVTLPVLAMVVTLGKMTGLSLTVSVRCSLITGGKNVPWEMSGVWRLGSSWVGGYASRLLQPGMCSRSSQIMVGRRRINIKRATEEKPVVRKSIWSVYLLVLSL